ARPGAGPQFVRGQAYGSEALRAPAGQYPHDRSVSTPANRDAAPTGRGLVGAVGREIKRCSYAVINTADGSDDSELRHAPAGQCSITADRANELGIRSKMNNFVGVDRHREHA